MPRPKKWRKVCSLPEINRFGPLNGEFNDECVVMSVDEYETIRLIDLGGYEAGRMLRTNEYSSYNSTRNIRCRKKKIADSLVNGKTLIIEGGEYRLCDGHGGQCGKMSCGRHRGGRNKEE